MKKSVQLNLYMHDSTETVIESFPARDWEDFIIIKFSAAEFNQEAYMQMVELFREHAAKMDKEVILVPSDWDIEFYGVEVYEEGTRDTNVLGESLSLPAGES